jgi:glycosyltransferase involved in cell wall biosynthesis
MNEHRPKITIGMTSFFARDTIAQAIESALAQDYTNTEILIVDDCSGDDSVDVIQKAIDGQPHARLIIHEKNTGFAGALNTIIQNTTGEFLAIFDDDDVSAVDRLTKQYERIIAYEKTFATDMVLCHAARLQTYENGFQRYEKTVGTKDGIAPNGQDMARRILVGTLGGHGENIVGSCANCARMGRVSVFRKLGGFDSTMRRAEDTDFSIRFALAGGHFVGIALPLVYQTMTGGAEKSVDAEEVAETIVLNKHADFLKGIGWYDFVRDWMGIRYAYYRNEWRRMAVLMMKLAVRAPIRFLKKIYWSIPAGQTRGAYKDWHSGKLKGQSQ